MPKPTSHLASLWVIYCLTFTLSLIPECHAQASPQSAPIEEIVIRAQKRDQTLQDVPLSLSLVDAQQLDQGGAASLQDVGYWQPNVRLSPQITVSHYANFYIRGMGLNGSVVSDEPAVGVFVDDLYLGFGGGVLTDFVDVDSVQILRGPQGTLYGHSTTAGVVKLTHQPPVFHPGFTAKVKLGSDKFRSLAATMTNQLDRNGHWAGRLSVLTKEQDGAYRNIHPLGEDIGAARLKVIKPSLRWLPNDNFESLLRLEAGKSTSTVGPRYALLEGSNNRVERLFDLHQVPRPDEGTLMLNNTPDLQGRWAQAVLTVDVGLTLGELKSITGYRTYDQEIAADADGSPFTVFEFSDDTEINQHQVSQEFVFNMDNSWMAITTGAYFFKQHIHYREHRLMDTNTDSYNEQWSLGELDHSSWSLFAHTEWDITPRLTLGLGARYNTETKSADYALRARQPDPPCVNGFASCVPTFSDRHTWRSWVPKISLQRYLNDMSHLFAQVSRGFRSGGFNMRAVLPSPVGPYKPEQVTAYEVGYKMHLADHGANLNIAAFYNVYDDLQKTALDNDGNQSILNAAAANIRGIEITGTLQPTTYLALNISVGRMWAGYKSFAGLDVDGDGVPDPELARSLDLPDVPSWTAAFQAALTHDLGWAILDLNLDYSFTSGFMTNEVNTAEVDGYSLFNATIGVTWGDHWSARLYGRNLLDKLHYISSFKTSCCTVGDRGPVREYGLSLQYAL